MYAVILAGGGGTRLWPMSRPETPKPFLPLLDERSLLQRTVDRLVGHPELSLTDDDIAVVTDRRYGVLVREQLPDARTFNEPVGRNTAAAIALATIAFERDPDEVMVVLPADHTIADEAAFRRVLAAAERLAEGAFDIEAPLVTLGIRITRPATDYGYLVPDVDRREKLHGLVAYPLSAFEEKPLPARAVELQGRTGTAWNAGIFVWRRRAIRDALATYTGLLTLMGPVASSEPGLRNAYEQLRPVSIDNAVMEGAARGRTVVMANADVGWNDLGSWTALLSELGARGTGQVIQAGESAVATEDDLVVARDDGRLTVSGGAHDILASSPVALLSGAAPSRDIVEALVERVADWEVRT
jgi:mannose-1-phosphate guanylyltransferase